MIDTRSKAASLLNFTFDKPVEIQFLKFELVSYWGKWGGGLQYFAAIPATSEQPQSIYRCIHDQKKIESQGGLIAETTTDGAITTTTADDITSKA